MDNLTQPLSSPLRCQPANPRRQAGLSLVELMISITIGLLLLAGISTLIVQQSSARSELEKSSRQIENGRYAMQILRDDIQHAGYYGEYSPASATPPAALPDPCATALADLVPAMTLPIQGYDSPATVPAPLSACLPDADHKAGTDILVIRRADTAEDVDVSHAVAGQIYLQATPTAYVLGSGSATGVFTLKEKNAIDTAELHKYFVHIYFVSPCNICSPADGIPTLKRKELTIAGGATTFSTTPLVEGIDQLQLDYGLDTTNDGTPDGNYITAPASTTDWANVMAIRVNLLARNNDPTSGYQDTKTYNLGVAGTFGPYSDPYKRHAYSELVRAINPSGRREQ